jgi:hypothetical protein
MKIQNTLYISIPRSLYAKLVELAKKNQRKIAAQVQLILEKELNK